MQIYMTSIVLLFNRIITQGNVTDSVNKPDIDNDDGKQKDKSPKADINPHADYSPGASSGQPAYVPYALYSKLLERVSIKIIHKTIKFSYRYIACTREHAILI